MMKLNLEMVPQGSLNHIAVEPTLPNSIIMAQLHDEGIKIIKEKLSQGEAKYKCFCVDHQEFCGLNLVLLYPRITNLEDKSLMRHIYQSFLFIPVVPRCTRILNRISGGLE